MRTSVSESPYTLKTEQLKRHSLPMACLGVALHSNGKFAFLACMDGVYQVEIESGARQRLYEHDSYASGVVCFAEFNQVVSAGYDGKLIWYDLGTRKIVRQIQAHTFWSWDLARAANASVLVSSSGQYLAGGYRYEPKPSEVPSVVAYNAESGEAICRMDFLPPVQAVAASADGKSFGAGNLMGDVAVWNRTGELQSSASSNDFTAFGHIKSHCQVGGIYAAAFEPKSNDLFVAGMGPMRDPMAGNGKQRWHRYAWGEENAKLAGKSNDKQVGEGLMETLVFHPSGDYFVMAGRLRGGNWDVGFFDTATGDLFHSLKVKRRVTQVEFSRDGTQLILSAAGKQERDPKKEFGLIEVYSVSREAKSA